MLAPASLPAMLGTDGYLAAWIDRRGGSINPLAYARGLIAAALAAGAAVYRDTPALALAKNGARWQLRTPQASVDAERVFVATGAYGEDLVPGLARSIVPVRTAQVATVPLDDPLRSTILPGGQCASDTRRLLTSFRLSPDGRLVMGGAAATGTLDHRALLPHLHRAGDELFGRGASLPWQLGWSGYFAVTRDHLPHWHESGDGVWCALGCNGRGIAVSTALGQLVAQRLLGARTDDLPFPPTPMRPFPFHAFRNAGIAVATEVKRVQDRADRRASRPAAAQRRRPPRIV
jgi:glycine/D-amino acid oxidase-like deaminating enzyme